MAHSTYVNTNPKTGIAYGFAALNDLDGDVADDLMYRHGTAHYGVPDEDLTEDDEPLSYSGKYEDVEYELVEFGGAWHMWVYQSPIVTETGYRASPCVPNACILKKETGGDVTGYGIPDDWWSTY